MTRVSYRREPPSAAQDGTPADRLVGVTSQVTAQGSVVNTLIPLPRCTDDFGDVAAGVLCVLADAILGNAVFRSLDDDLFIVTSNLHLDLAKPVGLAGGEISGSAAVDSIDRHGSLCRADLRDRHGDFIAAASARFALVHRDSRHAGAVEGISAAGERTSGPAAGSNPAAAHATSLTAVEQCRVDPERVPIRQLLGMELAGVEGSVYRFLVHPGPDVANGRGGIHGGIGGLIGEQAAAFALRLVLPRHRPMRPVELRACFLRPVNAAAGPIACTAEILHVGNRFAVTRVQTFTQTGKPAVLVDLVHAPLVG